MYVFRKVKAFVQDDTELYDGIGPLFYGVLDFDFGSKTCRFVREHGGSGF